MDKVTYVERCSIVFPTAIFAALVFSCPLYFCNYLIAACIVWIVGLLVGGGIALAIGTSVGWFEDR